jgi:hypothetical protein
MHFIFLWETQGFSFVDVSDIAAAAVQALAKEQKCLTLIDPSSLLA